jgi:hypothetical protein
MGRGNSKKAGRDGNRPGLVRSCSALGPAASAIACMQSWRHAETLKPLGSAFVPVYGRHGPRAKSPSLENPTGGLWRSPMTPAISRSREPAVLAYLTRQRSWMLNDFAFGQLASSCPSSDNFISPYFSISFATL